MSEIPKAYEPQSVEDKWYDFWLKWGCFTADPARVSEKRPAYSIVIPPPNVTGVLTLGHVLNNTIQDILARKARMEGKEVLWLPGTDHAGIATQTVVERALKKESKIKHRVDLGREKFLEKVWEWKEKHGGIIIQQLKKLGCSCDWTRERFTMDPEYSRCVQKVFVELYRRDLIYRGERMVNWCPVSLTALSDEEVVMKEQEGFLYYFKVEVAEPDGTPVYDDEGKPIWLTIATTRPETIPGDTAVAVNPKDTRYAHLIGKYVRRPLPVENQAYLPIIPDQHVDFAFGTGVLKVTPAHDKADDEIYRRHIVWRINQNPEAPRMPDPIEVIGPSGFMTEVAGVDLNGLDRFEARKVAVEKLKEIGAWEKEEPYTHSVGFSERANVPIESRRSEQWFLKYPSAEQSRACVVPSDAAFAQNLADKFVTLVNATGQEFTGRSVRSLRKAALAYARKHGFLGVLFKNEDLGVQIRVGRQSLSHSFSNLGVANIQAVAVLPELIRTAVWLSSEPHVPSNPMFKKVHRFVGALSLAGELHRVIITAKEFWDGTILYDHKTKKVAPGGKSLEAHLPKEKLDTQPAPSAEVKVSDLFENVNTLEKLRFHPQRWAKVYGHWMENIKDWCISRQLWWGHRIPVWHKTVRLHPQRWQQQLGEEGLLQFFGIPANVSRTVGETVVRIFRHRQWYRINPSFDPHQLLFTEPQSPWDDFEVYICSEHEETGRFFEAKGFRQDPDVLDTWCSSWLWPFATMGWTGDPEKDSQNATLKAFYPTTDLVTGPDIIFFWVARMIMAGYEYMGEMPFRNVYFTGIIRDKQGRKMSKSLGNSPDPLDLIGKFGADALRFGVMRAAPLGQDILFDEQNVELGRNFCNKLWNACRFRQMQGGEAEGEIEPALLTSDDKWILLKLDRAIREITAAFTEYRFNEATQSLYRFFWSEYCDWYVEASKAALRPLDASKREGVDADGDSSHQPPQRLQPPDPAENARRANKIAVIDFVLGHALRLFHPFLPFITEELWHGLGYNQGLPKDQGGDSIMFARWPKPLDEEFKEHYGLDEGVERFVNAKYELVTQGRNLRREGGVPSNKRVRFVFQPAAGFDLREADVLQLLLNAEPFDVTSSYQPKKGTPTIRSSLGELYLPLDGLIDVEAERARLAKELAKVDAEIGKVRQKLSNPSFVEKVPPAVLEEHKNRLTAWEAKRGQLQAVFLRLE